MGKGLRGILNRVLGNSISTVTSSATLFSSSLSRCESGVIKDTPLVLISQVSVRLSCYLFILVMWPPPFTRFVMIYRIEPHQFGLQLRFVRSFRDH